MFNVQSLRNTRVFQEGVEEGIEQNKLEMIPKLVAAGLSLEKIAEITSLSLKQVREALVSPEQASEHQVLEDESSEGQSDPLR